MQSVQTLSELISWNEKGFRYASDGKYHEACTSFEMARLESKRARGDSLCFIAFPSMQAAENVSMADNRVVREEDTFVPDVQRSLWVYSKPISLIGFERMLTGASDQDARYQALSAIDMVINFNDGLAHHLNGMRHLKSGKRSLAKADFAQATVRYAMALPLDKTHQKHNTLFDHGLAFAGIYSNLAHVSLLEGDIAVAQSYANDLVGLLNTLGALGRLNGVQAIASRNHLRENIVHIYTNVGGTTNCQV